jgi:hypothetical protein
VTTTLLGGCHCGNIKIAFETALDPRALQLRSCQCAFCRRHGGITMSDPAGRLRVEVRQLDQLQRYRFALGITDFLICRTCGVYVAAVMETGGRVLGVVNVNALDDIGRFAHPPMPMEYGTETAEGRQARRTKTWMPVDLRS